MSKELENQSFEKIAKNGVKLKETTIRYISFYRTRL